MIAWTWLDSGAHFDMVVVPVIVVVGAFWLRARTVRIRRQRWMAMYARRRR